MSSEDVAGAYMLPAKVPLDGGGHMYFPYYVGNSTTCMSTRIRDYTGTRLRNGKRKRARVSTRVRILHDDLRRQGIKTVIMLSRCDACMGGREA